MNLRHSEGSRFWELPLDDGSLTLGLKDGTSFTKDPRYRDVEKDLGQNDKVRESTSVEGFVQAVNGQLERDETGDLTGGPAVGGK